VLRAEMADQLDEPFDISGSEELNLAQTSRTEWVHQIADVKDQELGRFKIVATAVSRLQDFLRNQPARIFYTINGQTHALERASFLNTRVGLPELRNHILINVVCDDMDKQA